MFDGKASLQNDAGTVTIRVKRDTHPLVRKEWEMLYTGTDALKSAAEKAEKNVRIKRGKCRSSSG